MTRAVVRSNSRSMITWLVLLHLYIKGIQALKFENLDVPGAVTAGQPVWLRCGYNLEGEELYSVKWYKNNVEFYRYLPSDNPPGQKYDLLGVYVDLAQSNETHVYLYKTDLNTEGSYGCEISMEAPSFITVKADKDLRVYVLPQWGPFIEGIEPPYQLGDKINVTCTSGPSKPAVQLKWILNGAEVQTDSEIRYPPIRHSGGLQTTKIGLEMELDFKYFRQSEMQLRCLASIAQVYSSSSEELVIGDRGTDIVPYHISHSAPGQRGPTIHGNLPWYDVGDVVDVNCSTTYPAEIKWYVNDYEAHSSHVIKYPVKMYADGREVSVLGLRMRIEHYHFRSDELRLKCTATQYKMITTSSEKTLRSGNQQNSGGFHSAENTGSGSYYRHIRWWVLQTLVMTMIKLSSSVYH